LAVGGNFVNNGLLDIMTWNGSLPAGLINNGQLLDRSAIKVQSYALNGRDFSVTIFGYTGHSYQLQVSSGLGPASWSGLGAAQPGNQASLVLTQTNALTATQRFYRVAVDPGS